jgi:predicted nucleic acid-binding protein
VKVVIDTSVVMSAIMSSHGRVADVLLNPLFRFERYSCYFMPIELFKHKSKLLQYSKLSEPKLLDSTYTTLRKIQLINESQVPSELWLEADELTREIDHKDISFIALSLYLEATLWTLDKKLTTHLKKKGFNNVVNTQGILDLLSK